MHRLLALFLLVLPLVAQDPAPGAFIGAGLGKDRRFMVDLGLSSGNVQTTAWGGHMGFMSRSSDTSDNSGSTYYTSKAPGAYTDTVDFQAFQLGVYAEVGRAWAALGVEHASETTRSYVVHMVTEAKREVQAFTEALVIQTGIAALKGQEPPRLLLSMPQEVPTLDATTIPEENPHV